jgi:hypothetical protein
VLAKTNVDVAADDGPGVRMSECRDFLDGAVLFLRRPVLKEKGKRKDPHQRTVPVLMFIDPFFRDWFHPQSQFQGAVDLLNGFVGLDADVEHPPAGSPESFVLPFGKLKGHVFKVVAPAKAFGSAEKHRTVVRPGSRMLVVPHPAEHFSHRVSPQPFACFEFHGNTQRVAGGKAKKGVLYEVSKGSHRVAKIIIDVKLITSSPAPLPAVAGAGVR